MAEWKFDHEMYYTDVMGELLYEMVETTLTLDGDPLFQ